MEQLQKPQNRTVKRLEITPKVVKTVLLSDNHSEKEF